MAAQGPALRQLSSLPIVTRPRRTSAILQLSAVRTRTGMRSSSRRQQRPRSESSVSLASVDVWSCRACLSVCALRTAAAWPKCAGSGHYKQQAELTQSRPLSRGCSEFSQGPENSEQCLCAAAGTSLRRLCDLNCPPGTASCRLQSPTTIRLVPAAALHCCCHAPAAATRLAPGSISAGSCPVLQQQ